VRIPEKSKRFRNGPAPPWNRAMHSQIDAMLSHSRGAARTLEINRQYTEL